MFEAVLAHMHQERRLGIVTISTVCKLGAHRKKVKLRKSLFWGV